MSNETVLKDFDKLYNQVRDVIDPHVPMEERHITAIKLMKIAAVTYEMPAALSKFIKEYEIN